MVVKFQEILRSEVALGAVCGAYLVADLGNGGQERQLYNLVSQISEDKTMLIIPWDYNEEDRYVKLLGEAPNILVLNLEGKGFKAKVSRIRQVLKATNASYLHSYSNHLNFVAWFACLGLRKRAIGGVRNRLVLNRRLNGKLRFYLSLVFPYFRISNNYNCFLDLDWPTRVLSKIFSKTIFVHNGIDTERFKPSIDRTLFYSQPGPLRTISVGRLYPVKQIDQIIDWVFEMKKKGFQVLHRHAGQGPEKDFLLKKIQELQLAEDFQFAGNVTNVPEFMNSADFLIHAAKFEGCPNVIMEAMACGLPILSSDAGDISVIVDQGQSGFVYTIDDRESRLEYGVQLASNADLMSQFSKNAVKKARKEFGLNQYVVAIRKAYKQMGINI